MKTTEIFRNQLGLSQEMMANYLRITRSQLSMYELGKRELSTAALGKLAEISVFFEQNKITDAVETEFLNKQDSDLKAFLEFQIKELEYKKIKEERLFESIQKKFRQNLALYHFALHLQNTKEALAEVLLQQANKGMKKYGLLNQTQHFTKIEAIKSQLDYFQSLKEK